MRKLLVICGPTATGKTKLAVYLSKVFGGRIISADSRQVYKYMDIGTGKERPEGIEVLGYDLVGPDQEFSVKNYVDFASKKINEAYKKDLLPILVGGTGLYIKAVVDNLERIYLPRNLKLRKELSGKNPRELFSLLVAKNPSFALKLNDSDRKNPVRLIRALEIVSFTKRSLGLCQKPAKTKVPALHFDSVLWLGLKASNEELKERIEARVMARIDAGFEKETEYLKKNGFLGQIPGATLGYAQWIKYLDGKISRDEAIEEWKREEMSYAKRQMTWFKKEKRINWFEITESDWMKKVEGLVKKWYDLD